MNSLLNHGKRSGKGVGAALGWSWLRHSINSTGGQLQAALAAHRIPLCAAAATLAAYPIKIQNLPACVGVTMAWRFFPEKR